MIGLVNRLGRVGAQDRSILSALGGVVVERLLKRRGPGPTGHLIGSALGSTAAPSRIARTLSGYRLGVGRPDPGSGRSSRDGSTCRRRRHPQRVRSLATLLVPDVLPGSPAHLVDAALDERLGLALDARPTGGPVDLRSARIRSLSPSGCTTPPGSTHPPCAGRKLTRSNRLRTSAGRFPTMLVLDLDAGLPGPRGLRINETRSSRRWRGTGSTPGGDVAIGFGVVDRDADLSALRTGGWAGRCRRHRPPSGTGTPGHRLTHRLRRSPPVPDTTVVLQPERR